MRRLCMFLLLSCLSTFAISQELVYEQGWVQFSDGQQRQLPLSFNSLTDVLRIVTEQGQEQSFGPDQVQSFTYEGFDYYSLPLNGRNSFFRILYEGSNFAVLHKDVSKSLLEYFVHTTKGAVQICGDDLDPEVLVLCEQELGPDFGLPVYGETSVQYKVQDAIFLAKGNEVHLVSCKYDTEGQLFATVPSLHKKNKRLLKRLKQVVQNDQQMQALRKYAATAHADLEDPEQLILALKTIYY